jgi:hypothetical protein
MFRWRSTGILPSRPEAPIPQGSLRVKLPEGVLTFGKDKSSLISYKSLSRQQIGFFRGVGGIFGRLHSFIKMFGLLPSYNDESPSYDHQKSVENDQQNIGHVPISFLIAIVAILIGDV